MTLLIRKQVIKYYLLLWCILNYFVCSELILVIDVFRHGLFFNLIKTNNIVSAIYRFNFNFYEKKDKEHLLNNNTILKIMKINY